MGPQNEIDKRTRLPGEKPRGDGVVVVAAGTISYDTQQGCEMVSIWLPNYL